MSNQPFDNRQDVLLALKAEKEKVRKQLRLSRNRMSGTMHEVFGPVPATTNKVQGISRLVSNGMAIYEGLRIGASFIRATRSLFGGKRRRRR